MAFKDFPGLICPHGEADSSLTWARYLRGLEVGCPLPHFPLHRGGWGGKQGASNPGEGAMGILEVTSWDTEQVRAGEDMWANANN